MTLLHSIILLCTFNCVCALVGIALYKTYKRKLYDHYQTQLHGIEERYQKHQHTQQINLQTFLKDNFKEECVVLAKEYMEQFPNQVCVFYGETRWELHDLFGEKFLTDVVNRINNQQLNS